MTYERISEILKNFGLTQLEREIYLTLTIHGPQMRKEIADALKLKKNLLEKPMKQLQNKSLVRVTIGRPAIFSVVPLDQALNSLVEKENKQADNLEKKREAILSYWRNLTNNW